MKKFKIQNYFIKYQHVMCASYKYSLVINKASHINLYKISDNLICTIIIWIINICI